MQGICAEADKLQLEEMNVVPNQQQRTGPDELSVSDVLKWSPLVVKV